LFGLGANGDLCALDAASGQLIWKLNLRHDLGGAMMGLKVSWGYSESLLVDQDRVLCTPGGKQGTVAALDAGSGKVLWRSGELTDPAAYTSPVAANFGGVRQYVVLTSKHVAGVRAADGSLLWKIAVPLATTAVVTTPLVTDEQVYVTSDYGTGCSLLRVTKNDSQFEAEIVYSNKVMSNHHGGVVLVDGCVYGWSGKTNGRGRWICQELASGKELWSEESAAPAGAPVAAGGHLYCFTQEEGTLVCIRAATKGWQETGRFTIPERTTMPSVLGQVWAHPVIAGKRLYLRDQDLLFCYDLAE
jgi:outer membrane protein assembly factor BamB